MTLQYDLFGDDQAEETTRYREALTCLADVVDNALALLIGVRDPMKGETKAYARGPWAWAVTAHGFHVQDRTTWGGWLTRPAHLVTWTELDRLIGTDPRLPDLRAWYDAQTALDGWRDRTRPAELGPGDMAPRYVKGDHARTGWHDRLHAWQQAIAICRDTRDGL